MVIAVKNQVVFLREPELRDLELENVSAAGDKRF
jgi:hypothetical protein